MMDSRKGKANLGRGKSHGGIVVKYMCFGKRKDPKGKHVSDYAFRPHIGELCIDRINFCSSILHLPRGDDASPPGDTVCIQ
jgi:hypothetical protein